MAHRNALTRLEENSAALLRTQSAALANPLWNLDYEQINLSLEAIATNREIVVVRIFGEDGEIMAQAGHESALQGDELLFRGQVIFDAGAGPREIGEIVFLITQIEIRTQTRDRLLLAAFIALAAVAMEVGAALFALRRIVGVPLDRLLKAINTAKSDRSRTRVIEGPPDEMGQVISAFNQMLDQQAVYESELTAQARMESELNIGREMQLSMVPHDFNALTKGHPISLSAALEPAREVGGDFYDAFHVGDQTLCVVIGDVSDKGVPAALLMAVTKTMVKSFALEGVPAKDIVTAVNEELCRGDHRNMFVTLFVGLLDLKTGLLTHCNAGHNPPLRLSASGRISPLPDRNGPVVGAVPGQHYSQSLTQMEEGETLLLYTDGVTEASDAQDRLFGDQGLSDLLTKLPERSTAEIVRAIIHAVADHEGEADRTDDVTVLAATFHGNETVRWNGSAPATMQAVSKLSDEMAEALAESNADLTAKAQLILDEIASNVVNHAGGCTDVPIEIEVDVTQTSSDLVLTISDTGPGFDPSTVDAPDTTLSVDERPIGGLGLHVVREISSAFSYARQADKNSYYIVINA
ncbi:ATP-binding SpoIIE family protein phosphatase [Roseovarius albus]|nr:SpoIIE family protein phosphatase [Roseovarius albus]